MKKVAFFGGTGGLGVKTGEFLRHNYIVDSVGSDKVNFKSSSEITTYFKHNTDVDVVVLFNNYNFNSFIHKYTVDTTRLQDQIQINIEGITRVVSEALKVMRNNSYGRIIIASSITADRSVMGTGVYAACKAYCDNLVKTIALENGSKGITANCIQLGYMDAGLCDQLTPEFREKLLCEIPCGRFGSSEEIAQVIDFMIDTEYVNGSTVKLTGGLN